MSAESYGLRCPGDGGALCFLRVRDQVSSLQTPSHWDEPYESRSDYGMQTLIVALLSKGDANDLCPGMFEACCDSQRVCMSVCICHCVPPCVLSEVTQEYQLTLPPPPAQCSKPAGYRMVGEAADLGGAALGPGGGGAELCWPVYVTVKRI